MIAVLTQLNEMIGGEEALYISTHTLIQEQFVFMGPNPDDLTENLYSAKISSIVNESNDQLRVSLLKQIAFWKPTKGKL